MTRHCAPDKQDIDKRFGKPWWHWALVVILLTGLALYFGSQTYWVGHYNRITSNSWTRILYWNLAIFYLWGLLSPVVFWGCRRVGAESHGWTWTVLFHLVFAGVLALFHCLLTSLTNWLWNLQHYLSFSFAADFVRSLVYRFQLNTFLYFVLVAFWHAFDYHGRFHERRLKAAELEANLANAHLLALKMQLQPHFLFNTLQAIAELVHVDINAAEEVTLRLSDLLRRTLASGASHEVSLREEIEFSKAYLEIEQVRLKDRLNVKLDIESSTLSAQVPSFLLQPLVENAVRHGIAPFPGKGLVNIRSRGENGKLLLEVSDNGPGLRNQSSADGREGIGLGITRERLRQLYGAEHSFELVSGAGLTVRIGMPFRRAAGTTDEYQLA